MKKYRLISWNVNGLRAVARKGFVSWLSVEAPDVLCLQETKAMPSQLSDELLNIPHYGAEFCWGERKGYSGVGTYSRSRPKKIERGIGVTAFDKEGRVLVHHFPEFVLFNVYFPNGKSRRERLDYKMGFYEEFLKAMKRYRKKGCKNIVVCGDVNTAHKEIDLARPKANSKISGFLPEERKWIDKFLDNGFIDAFRVFDKGAHKYTWWDMQSRARERNIGWRIDYFFVSETLKKNLKSALIHDVIHGSDHCPIELELRF